MDQEKMRKMQEAMYQSEELNHNKSSSDSRPRFKSEKQRTTLKLHKDVKILFDELVHEERENKISFLDRVIETYAKEHQPKIYDSYLKKELKLQQKDK